MKKHKTAMRLFKYVRNKKGLSQSAFAKYLGVSQTVISFVESGARPPSGKLLKTLIDKENTTIKELLEEMFKNGST